MHTPHLIDVNEGARLTGLRPQTLYRLARQGRIHSYRVLGRSLRFDRSDLARLVEDTARVPNVNERQL